MSAIEARARVQRTLRVTSLGYVRSSFARRAIRQMTSAVLAAGLIACGSNQSEDADPPPVLVFASTQMRLIAGSDTLRLLTELATSPEQQTLGLMERRHLADSAGMLFLYSDEQSDSAGFWMYRTRIPLDIAFMDATGTVRAIKQMAPCPTTLAAGCPSYLPGVPYRAALEVSAGYFARQKVGLGARVVLADTSRHMNGSSSR